MAWRRASRLIGAKAGARVPSVLRLFGVPPLFRGPRLSDRVRQPSQTARLSRRHDRYPLRHSGEPPVRRRDPATLEPPIAQMFQRKRRSARSGTRLSAGTRGAPV